MRELRVRYVGTRLLDYRLLSVEPLVPVVGLVGYMAFHAANAILERIEFRFELPKPYFSGTVLWSIENDVSGSADWRLDRLELNNEGEDQVNESGWKE